MITFQNLFSYLKAYFRNFASLFLFTSTTILAFTLIILGVYWKMHLWGHTKTPLSKPLIVDFEPGSSLKNFATLLHNSGLVSSREKFYWYVRIFHSNKYIRFQAGRYQFTSIVSPEQIIEAVLEGRVHKQVVLRFTIPEGFTLKQVNKRLSDLNLWSLDRLHSLSHSQSYVRSLGIEGQSLEGYIYPATYSFYKEIPSPDRLYETMVQQFFKTLPFDFLEQCEDKGITLHQAVTIASMIEKETPWEDEKPFVAEVIWNRLKKKIPLCIDATIIYGLEEFDGDLTYKHLQDKGNPYNTRVRTGLPPGPIASPSISSLIAVFNQSEHGYFYYVVNGDSGRHHFSKTLSEHRIHVKKLVLRQRRVN